MPYVANINDQELQYHPDATYKECMFCQACKRAFGQATCLDNGVNAFLVWLCRCKRVCECFPLHVNLFVHAAFGLACECISNTRALYIASGWYCTCTVSAGQCPVSMPTVVSSSSSDDICAVVTQRTLRYTCNSNNNLLIWSSSVFSGTINVLASGTTCLVPMPANGVTLTENDNNNATCLNSTLTFTGTVADLEQLNGVVLTCTDGTGLTDSVTIVIPGKST